MKFIGLYICHAPTRKKKLVCSLYELRIQYDAVSVLLTLAKSWQNHFQCVPSISSSGHSTSTVSAGLSLHDDLLTHTQRRYAWLYHVSVSCCVDTHTRTLSALSRITSLSPLFVQGRGARWQSGWTLTAAGSFSASDHSNGHWGETRESTQRN